MSQITNTQVTVGQSLKTECSGFILGENVKRFLSSTFNHPLMHITSPAWIWEEVKIWRKGIIPKKLISSLALSVQVLILKDYIEYQDLAT